MSDTTSTTQSPDAQTQLRFPTAYTVLFLLILIVTALTGIIPAGSYDRIMDDTVGREIALGGTTCGMAKETLAFYAILIPIMIAAGIGALGSSVNPFATVIAANVTAIPFTDGIVLRFILLIGGLVIWAAYVMRYASRVKADPSRSVAAKQAAAHRAIFLKGRPEASEASSLTGTQSIVLVIFGLTFAEMIWGVSSQGWWMARMGALSLGSAIVIGLVARMDEKEITGNFVDGARDLLGVALVVGLARVIVVVMENGLIADTILHNAEQSRAGLGDLAFINLISWIEVGMSFFMPSSSGLAVLSMPILAPLADFAGVARSLVVTAYQSANGLDNLINPTFAVLIGGLAIGRVSHDRWLVLIWPLLLILTIFISAALSISAVI